jgi:caffeoyl-CoA O-methyltransferase
VIDRVRPGGLIIADNVLWDGKILLPPKEQDEATRSLSEYARRVKNDARVEQVMVPIRDGVLLARRK